MTRVKSRVIEVGSRHDKGSKEEMEQAVEEVAEVLMRYEYVFLEMFCKCAWQWLMCSIVSTPEPFPYILQGKPEPPINPDRAAIDVNEVTRCTTAMCHYKAMLFLFRPSLRRLISRLRDARLSARPIQAVVLTEHEKQTVRMTYTACHSIIATSGYLARTHEQLTSRMFTVWVQTFSAAVSVAALAIWCAPFVEEEGFALKGYQEIKMACNMIGAHGCERAKGVLVSMLCLYDVDCS